MSNVDLKILCVDDEVGILDLYDVAVARAGFTAILASDPREALRLFQADMASIVLVISDFKMPGMNGFELRKAILPGANSTPFVVVSSYVTKEMALEALELKIAAFFDKPINEGDIAAMIKKESAPRLEAIRECQALEGIFVEEAAGILDEMEPVILSLDHDRANQDALNLIYRGAHTLKGSSGSLDSDVITKYVHKFEDIISGLRKNDLTLTDEVYETLLRGVDRIKEMVAGIATKELAKFDLAQLLPELELRSQGVGGALAKAGAVQPVAAAPGGGNTQKAKAKDSVSVPVVMLDELSGFSGEITVIRNMVNKITRSLETKYPGHKDIQSLGELLDEMHKINSTIQARITDLRKVPLAGVLKPIPRIIRDLSRDLGKSIRLTIEGESLRVDSALAGACSNSLIHLVRNSADHGIELPQIRAAAGKPEAGAVAITCTEDRDEVTITIRDDGRGIDHRLIRAKALEKGLFTEAKLAAMSEQEALRIIFASGFSTAASVTNVSGRGVGMDMVKSSVESVGGLIDIESAPGSGSTFTLRLPVPKSVLIINSLLVEAAGRSFAIPQDSIMRVLRIEQPKFRSLVQKVASGVVLRYEDAIYPLIDLRQVLRLNGGNPPDLEGEQGVVEMLIVMSGNLRYALQVDGIQDSEEIVVKRLQPCFNPQGVYAGATFMGDGTIGLILDVRGLAELAGVRELAATARPDAQSVAGEAVDAPVALTCSYLLFDLGSKTLYGAPLSQVFRLEEIDRGRVQRSGVRRVVIYRDRVMPIYSVEALLKLTPSSTPAAPRERLSVIVAEGADGFVGLEVDRVVDIAESDREVSGDIRDRMGVTGNTFIRNDTVTILDLPTVLAQSVSVVA